MVVNLKNIILTEKRINKGLTQSQVAAKAKISVRGYQYFENGRTPNVKVAIRIADALDVTDLRSLWKT